LQIGEKLNFNPLNEKSNSIERRFWEMYKDKYFKTVVRRLLKYEKALIGIACFNEGEEVNGSFDEPGSAKEAREALGKAICKQVLNHIRKEEIKCRLKQTSSKKQES
jgi:hypothetical protein